MSRRARQPKPIPRRAFERRMRILSTAAPLATPLITCTTSLFLAFRGTPPPRTSNYDTPVRSANVSGPRVVHPWIAGQRRQSAGGSDAARTADSLGRAYLELANKFLARSESLRRSLPDSGGIIHLDPLVGSHYALVVGHWTDSLTNYPYDQHFQIGHVTWDSLRYPAVRVSRAKVGVAVALSLLAAALMFYVVRIVAMHYMRRFVPADTDSRGTGL